MSAYQVQVLVIDFAVLFSACALYAYIISRKAVREWYLKNNKTYVMVIIGVLIILLAVGALIPFGIVDLASFGVFVLACCVAGAPMVIGQRIQDAKDTTLYEATQQRKHNHDTEDPRR